MSDPIIRRLLHYLQDDEETQLLIIDEYCNKRNIVPAFFEKDGDYLVYQRNSLDELFARMCGTYHCKH